MNYALNALMTVNKVLIKFCWAVPILNLSLSNWKLNSSFLKMTYENYCRKI